MSGASSRNIGGSRAASCLVLLLGVVLLGGGEQVDLADVLQEELQRVGGELRVDDLLDILGLHGVEVGLRVLCGVERRDFLVILYDDRLDLDRLVLEHRRVDVGVRNGDALHVDPYLAHGPPSLPELDVHRMRNCRKRTGRTP